MKKTTQAARIAQLEREVLRWQTEANTLWEVLVRLGMTPPVLYTTAVERIDRLKLELDARKRRRELSEKSRRRKARELKLRTRRKK